MPLITIPDCYYEIARYLDVDLKVLLVSSKKA